VAYDDSAGPHRGRLYLTYLDSPYLGSTHTTVYLRYSDDAVHWSDPIRVSTGTKGSAFFPDVAVDPKTGIVGVSWFDSRNAVAENGAQLFAAFSDSGGKTFSSNVVVSKGISVDARANPTNSRSSLGYGDYANSAFYDSVFYPCWADNSNSTGDNPDGTTYLDVYTAPVKVTSTRLHPTQTPKHPAQA
jgi:hypothetical protein